MIVESISTIETQVQVRDSARIAVSDMSVQRSEPEQKAEPETEVSQALLDDVQHDIQMMRNVGLQFSVHGPSGRTVVRVVDKETQELIREIPPEEFLSLAARVYAFLQGRAYVTPQDIKAVAPDVLRHRIILTYEAEAEDITTDQIINQVFDSVEVP